MVACSFSPNTQEAGVGKLLLFLGQQRLYKDTLSQKKKKVAKSYLIYFYLIFCMITI